MAQQREEEKRKRDVKKDKSKASKTTQQAGDLSGSNAAPGSLIGHLPDQSVFWLFMEVRMSLTAVASTTCRAASSR